MSVEAPPPAGRSSFFGGPMTHLILLRIRSNLRNPSPLFFTFILPMLLGASLAVAFRTDDSLVRIAVVEGAAGDPAAARLSAEHGLAVVRASRPSAEAQLARGTLAGVVVPGAPATVLADATTDDGRWVSATVRAALEPAPPGTPGLVRTVDHPRVRYDQFILPGLMGLAVFGSSFMTVAFEIVMMRHTRVLKRFCATPMRRWQLIASFLVSRAGFAIVEAVFYLAFARWALGIRPRGSGLELVGLTVFAALSFAGIGLLTIARFKDLNVLLGISNVVMLAFALPSGAFFSISGAPAWLQVLLLSTPVAALVDASRGILFNGVSVFHLPFHLAVLAVWGVASYLAAFKLFQWW